MSNTDPQKAETQRSLIFTKELRAAINIGKAVVSFLIFTASIIAFYYNVVMEVNQIKSDLAASEQLHLVKQEYVDTRLQQLKAENRWIKQKLREIESDTIKNTEHRLRSDGVYRPRSGNK